jgi:hypothetical protein
MIKDVVYTIKSHKRVDRFRQKTYEKVILNYGFDLSKVYVFVSLDEDVELYTKAYPEINIVKAPLGVAGVDNFITDYFPEKQKIIYMNDDVTQICEVSPDNKFIPVAKDKLHTLCDNMFSVMETNDITYAGFYPVVNTMFMTNGNEVKTSLCLIMDPFSLVINNQKVRVTISDKSDFEKSILHYQDKGALLRYNRVAFKAEYYGKVGGFQGRNQQTELNTANELMKKYPFYVAGVNVKKEGKTSLKLKSLPATKNVDVTILLTEEQKADNSTQISLF